MVISIYKLNKDNKVINLNSLNNYEFITIPLWKNKEIINGEKTSKEHIIVIGLRDKNTGVHIIHPISSFIINWRWRTNEFNTKKKHANNIIKFLNYLLQNKKSNIKSLTDLDIATGNEYLNSLTKDNLKRGTIIDARRTLTSFYIWLSLNDSLPKVEKSYIKSKEKKNLYTDTSYYEALFEPILPEHQKSNKRHLFPIKYLPLLFEVCILVAQPIVLGLYLQIFGGLRAGEVVNLKKTQFKKKVNSGDFLLNITEQQFRTDIKDSSGADYVKRIRKQQVLQIKDWGDILFKDHIELYKDKDITGSGALFINRDGKPMTGKSYSQYFYKMKKKFIDLLREHGSIEDKVVASDLLISDWGTHIGRGTFTNLIAEEIENPADLMFLRGDKDLVSSLPYLAKTERVRTKIEERIQHMHKEYIPRLIKRQNDLKL